MVIVSVALASINRHERWRRENRWTNIELSRYLIAKLTGLGVTTRSLLPTYPAVATETKVRTRAFGLSVKRAPVLPTRSL